jgi:hypothetical protein
MPVSDLVRLNDQLTNIVELEEEFTFELYFYGTSIKGAPITVWFAMDDLEDFLRENDRMVHSAVGLNLLAEFSLSNKTVTLSLGDDDLLERLSPTSM